MDGSPLWLGIACIFAGLMTKDVFMGKMDFISFAGDNLFFAF